MDIQPLGQGRLIIHMAHEELRELHPAPGNLGTKEAAQLLRRALGEGYDRGWDNAYLELICGRDSLLLIALQHSGSPQFFSFPGIEPVLDVAALCPPGLVSFLTAQKNAYVLTVYPWRGGLLPSSLYEYGTPLEQHPHYALHLLEHGQLIAGPSALDTLKAAFA